MMHNSKLLIVLGVQFILCLAPALSCSACERHMSDHVDKKLDVKRAVQLLGDQNYINKDENYWALFVLLGEHPRQAIPGILKTLHAVSVDVIKPTKNPTSTSDYYQNSRALLMVDYIRALQFITNGLSFTAPTNVPLHRMNPVRREFIQKLPEATGNLVTFYGIWDSRALIFLAPVDAQRAIIEKWKMWFKRCGNVYPYPRRATYVDPDSMIFSFDNKKCEQHAPKFCCHG